jgi:hypothetical protein
MGRPASEVSRRATIVADRPRANGRRHCECLSNWRTAQFPDSTRWRRTPQFDARVIRDAGHWLMLDKPTEFAGTLRDVVESIGSGKAKRRPI